MAQATTDRRRITGPEESFPPVFKDDEHSTWKHGEPRRGRRANDMRSIFLKAGLISQANGSAYIETDKTKVACAVYGPRQSKSSTYNESGKLNVEVKFTPFSCSIRRNPLRDAEDRTVSVLVHQALAPAVQLHLFPKAVIDVFVTVIECDGLDSCISAITVACSAALANAGIEMYGLVASCTAMVVGNEIWLDPDDQELKYAAGTIILACVPALTTITNIRQVGGIALPIAVQAMGLCQEQCTGVHQVIVQALLSSSETSEKGLS